MMALGRLQAPFDAIMGHDPAAHPPDYRPLATGPAVRVQKKGGGRMTAAQALFRE